MHKPTPKALFFDIDGTLIGLKSHKLNETDIASLQALKEKDLSFILESAIY